MVSFVNEKEPGRKGIETFGAMRPVLDRVHVNMPWKYLPRYLDLVLENGINVEIGFEAEEMENTPVADIAAAFGLFSERGCRATIHGPFFDLCPGSVDPGIREVSRFRLRRLFEIAERVSPVQIVCHTGFDPRHHRGQKEVWLANSLKAWGPAVERAARVGSPLLLENVWEEDPDLHLRLFEEIDSPWFGFCLDTGHQNAFSRTPLDAWLEATAGRLKEIHLHDNDGSWDDHLPIGEGNIDFDLLFGFLGKNGMRPVLTLEPHKVEHLYQSLNTLAQTGSFRELFETGQSA